MKTENYQDENQFPLDNVFEVLPAHVYWKDRDGIYLNCNDAQAKSLGFQSAQDIIGKNDFDISATAEIARILRENDAKIMKTGQKEIFEETVTINNKSFTFITHKAPLKDKEGNIQGIIGVSIDITKQKILEQRYQERTLELTKALEVKKDFLNNLSHEVRTPLQSMMVADVLYEEWDMQTDEEKKSIVKMIADSQDRLMSLCTNLLDLSKFNSGKFTFEFKYHDARKLIIDVMDEFKTITNQINLTINGDVDVHILCDDWRFKQAISHIIANAVKHGGLGKPIDIIVSNYKQYNEKYIKISIIDEGDGVPEDELTKIFNPFDESSRTKSKSGGTGLGLSLCLYIAKAHKGKIWAENNRNKPGSTFHLIIPYEKQDNKIYAFRLTRPS